MDYLINDPKTTDYTYRNHTVKSLTQKIHKVDK